MTGHLGYESTGLNALRGQNNVQGLNDAGANPAYLLGYQPAHDPEIRARFAARWGVEVPETLGYRLDQMISGMQDGRIRAFYLIENLGSHGAEREARRAWPRRARLPRLAGHLPRTSRRESSPTSSCRHRASRRRRGRSRTPRGA